MKRTIIKIEEEKCTGCGLCVSGCHEGALQLIDGKAVMVSELYCDGLGACIGECPEGAISLEEREATPYNESATMQRLIPKGEKVIVAHLKHLKDCQQHDLLKEGLNYLQQHKIPINVSEFIEKQKAEIATPAIHEGGGCPGSRAAFFSKEETENSDSETISGKSELQQWPIQLHLLSPQAPYLASCNLLLAADCTAFAVGNFHSKFLKGKRLAIACPKLDNGKEIYVEKLVEMIDHAKIDTLTVMIMEVPCCGGLLQLAKIAAKQAKRKIPLKAIIVGLQGNILQEEWVTI